MNDSFNTSWLQYVEIPRGQGGPVKLDAILAQRMDAFLRARKVRPFRCVY